MDVLPSETLAEYIERARAEQSAHFDAEIAHLEAMPDDAPEFQGTIWTKGARIAQMRQRDRSAESLLDVRSYEREWHRVNAERADPLLQCEQGDAAFAKLMAAPVSAPRKRVRRAKVELEESIATVGKSLADIIRGRRKPYQSPLSKPMPTYRHWLAKFLGPEDADREDARAKAEWQTIRSHQFVAAVLGGQWPASPRVTARIRARIARVRAGAVGNHHRNARIRGGRMSYVDDCTNLFGHLSPDIRRRLEAALRSPTRDTWEDAYTIIVDGDNLMTLWQAWLAVDPSAPRTGKVEDERGNVIEDWARIPDQMTLYRAVRYATREVSRTSEVEL